eukprot:SAG11_NODE_20407_length_446_cov_0.587896_1_plen_94_part_10
MDLRVCVQGGKSLGNTARDGIAVAEALKALPGSHVIELIDVNMAEIVTKERMLEAAGELCAKVAEDPENTTAVFGFFGHGARLATALRHRASVS